MPCLHKFSNDLQLEYVDWEVKTLFIGTFNPIWEACANNYSQWFYGRTDRNAFWCILPAIYGEQSLSNANKTVWVDFCKRHQLAITDIIRCFDDTDESSQTHREAICKFLDDDLVNFQATLNNIPAILETHIGIKQIVITRQNLPLFWQNCFHNTIGWIKQHPERRIRIKMLRSPSRRARKGVMGDFCDFIANRWIVQGYTVL